jgi:hypothetical protein
MAKMKKTNEFDSSNIVADLAPLVAATISGDRNSNVVISQTEDGDYGMRGDDQVRIPMPDGVMIDADLAKLTIGKVRI